MTKDVVTIEGDKTVLEAAKMMRLKKFSSLVVTDKGKTAGILTERDLVRKVLAEDRDPSKLLIYQIMSTELITTTPETSIENAAKVMTEQRVRRLPVMKNKKLVGIITASDIARHLSDATSSIEMLLRSLRKSPNHG
ncbi:MAG: CBS domain-containing protein [Thaumarchaeota archaeon]|nr:CBS domain-containing protein [Nitrososphaerota archaeon]MCL5316930.1 CBS domain-containing protein [Nitrososphaerota archaeon]